MTVKQVCLLVVICVLAIDCEAAHVWIVQGLTGGNPCITWRAGAVLHNRASVDAAVGVLHVSNSGTSSTIPQALTAGQSAPAVGGTANSSIWATELDVPSAIAVEGRLELYNSDCTQTGRTPALIPFAKIRMPVVTELTAAGQEQVHLGTDLGGEATRLNVGIYNASATPATAIIAVHRPTCSNSPITQIATVPPDTLIQVPISDIVPCTSPTTPQFSTTYTTVTVDQPSFSFISTLATGKTPSVTAAVSVN